MEPDAGAPQRRVASHVARNTGPIIEVLRDVLPPAGLVLEVASGTGEHGLHFARAFPQLIFQPTDPDPLALGSIEAWRLEGPDNLLPPLRLDASEAAWPVSAADTLLCINMVHISPWAATLGLMRGAGRLLQAGAPLILYGPYRRRDVATAPSNESFDQSLKSRDPEWGLRYLEDVVVAAQEQGLAHERVVEMPANNLMIVFRKTPSA
jgi:hypothetical protein